MKRDLLTIFDLSVETLEQILQRTGFLKAHRRDHPRSLEGKTVGLIFRKSSTRTRVSFEVGIRELGGHSLFLSSSELQLGRGESVKDSARVLSRYLHGLVIRTFAHEELEEWAHYASIPIVNGLCDLYHPCQILADLFTIQEQRGTYRGVKVAYVGDGNNVAHSWLAAAGKLGFHLAIASPPGYQPREEVVTRARELAQKSGSCIEILQDPIAAVRGAEVIYTDVWASMGQEAEEIQRLQAFQGYQVNQQLVEQASSPVYIMHCLPTHRGQEITEEVLEGENSLILEQAENRLHVQKAILEWVVG
ncbi:MAG: ornithine carbamoyltransferase [Candidatus Tectomicrobia bacterium]|uniref:Ornithine carbamoyltransferase n=1 Tax=Tectimicrobiota bacterium TaxID=2528274 RepID=A0A932FWL3_UNCTE|nr:ornithine carbamoyltransferase [Candidatus Tectomicrobia bacterium]